MKDLRSRTISSIFWNVFSQVGGLGLSFVIGIMLARLLSPADFGLIGMTAVFVGFVTPFVDSGFGSALIQRRDIQPDHYYSIFWANIVLGLATTLVFMALSPLIAQFYGQPILIPLTVLIALNFFIASLNLVQLSRLRRNLKFRVLGVIELIAIAVSGGAAIVMALLGLGVWSLAFQLLLLTTVKVILVWMVSDWRPALRFRWIAVKDLLGFSSGLLGYALISYWLRTVDNLLVGRLFGAAALGLYARSYGLMQLPTTMVSQTVGRAMFPALSSIQTERQRIANIYLQLTRMVALITFPMMLGLFVVADHFVLALFGESWLGMVPMVKIFCWVGMVQSIGALNNNIYLSQGRTDLQFKVGVIAGVLGIGAIVLGTLWGVIGVALSYGVFSLLVFGPTVAVAVSLVSLSLWQVLHELLGPFTCALVMALGVWALGFILPSDWPAWIFLVIQTIFGTGLYLLLIHIFRVKAYLELRQVLVERVHQLQPALIR